MRKILSLFIVGLWTVFALAQSSNVVTGTVLNTDDQKPLSDVKISIQNTNITTSTNTEGYFELKNVPMGEQIIVCQKSLFENVYFPVNVSKPQLNVGNITMYPDLTQKPDISIITLSEEELTDDEAGGADNIAGLLQSSKDAYQQAVAFNFSSVFFKERGYDSEAGEIMFNGIPMNKFSNGRPQWSEWGGLNDMMRNYDYSSGLNPTESSFGSLLGSTNYHTRASEYRAGGQVAYAATNTNYNGRVLATYNTGLLDSGWAFSLSGSRRYAQEGDIEGNSYNAWAGLVAIEKIVGKHAINLTAFYTPVRRGKGSPNTQEVYDLAGTKYNAYWGWQGDDKRNSRMKEIKQPTFFLSHNWDINDKSSLSTNLMYQTGTIGDSRLGYGGGSFNSNDPLPGNNPDPTYYKKLPSYFLNPDYINYQSAYENTVKFLNDAPESQIMWGDLYEENYRVLTNGTIFNLYEDKSFDKTMAGSIAYTLQMNDNIQLNTSFLYKNTDSENYAEILDLLGGQFLIDRDKFEFGNVAQNDLNNPNRSVNVGDKFMYDYNVNATQLEGFAQAQFKYEMIDFFISGKLGQTSYQRDGLFKNGKFANSSYGLGEQKDFLTYGFKGGATYKLSGRHLINVNGAYIEDAPAINNTYSNIRVSSALVPNVTTSKSTSGDISYIYRSPGVKARLTGYYTTIRDLSKVSFYFVEGVELTNAQSDATEDAQFLATALSGIDYKNFGGEFGIEIQATPTVSFTGAASMGQYTYDSNPEMFITLYDNPTQGTYLNQSQGYSYLKNYKQSGTPQTGFSIGATYRDPNFWWVSANANLLQDNYIGLSEFRRTNNFYIDEFDGQVINGLTQTQIDTILAQEKLDDVFLVNIIGGKSWKINDYYLGFTASVNNVLGEVFKTGGFEQARKANYTALNEDVSLENPLFGNKYWYGRDTTYFVNLYVRF